MARLRDRIRYQILRSRTASSALKNVRSGFAMEQLRKRRVMAERYTCDTTCQDLASALNADGYVILNKVLDPEALASLERAAAESLHASHAHAASAPEGTTSKAFWTRLLDNDLVDGRMPSKSAFTRFALQPGLISVLCRAFGTLPQLDYVLLTQSKSTGRELSQSQLWHRDHDDTRTIKVFTYLTDVSDEGDGPFTFVPGKESDRIGRTMRSHIDDAQLKGKLAGASEKAMIAPRLTTFAVETSRCLHMGSRIADGRHRLLYTATYTTFPKPFGSAVERFSLDGEETELERAILAPVS